MPKAKNEWGVVPGTQDSILPSDTHKLSEMECDLINLFRGFSESKQKMIVQALWGMLFHGKK